MKYLLIFLSLLVLTGCKQDRDNQPDISIKNEIFPKTSDPAISFLPEFPWPSNASAIVYEFRSKKDPGVVCVFVSDYSRPGGLSCFPSP